MSDLDDPTAQDPLAQALRTMYSEQAEAAGFEPLALPAERAAHATGHRRRGERLLLVAASVALLAGAGALLAQPLLRPQPVPGTPEPANPTQSAAPTPARTPFSGGGSWSWAEREPAPRTDFVEVDSRAGLDMTNAVTIDGVDYYVSLPREGGGEPPSGCLPARIHRYLSETGTWEEQGASPAPPTGLCPFEPIAYNGDLYVTLYDGVPVTDTASRHFGEMHPLLVYSPATGSWTLSDPFPTRPHAYAEEHCVRLPEGMFCAETTAGGASFTGRYEFLDVATRAWREGTSPDLGAIPVSPVGDIPRGVTVEGRSHVLFTASPFLSSAESGEMSVFLLDPETGTVVLRTSRRLPFAQLEAIRDPQLLAPGLLFGGPETVHDKLTTATVLDLRTGNWWDVRLPGPAPYPDEINDTLNFLDSAAWAKRVYGAELESYAVVRDYLYDPLEARWLVLPVVSEPPPDLDPPEGDEVTSYLWYGSGPLQCDYHRVQPCYELRADPLPRVAQDLSHEQVLARPTAVR